MATLKKNAFVSIMEKPVAKPTPPTLGTDPEFMLYDMTKQKIVSAIGVLKNDKYTPIDLGDGIKMYADNVMVEFSTPPADSIESFIRVMRIMLHRGQAKLGNNYRLVAKAAHVYDEEELADPKAREAGCSPNFDAYKGEVNNPPVFRGGLRTGSFHIHIGHPALMSKDSKEKMIKALDLTLGMASLLFDTDPTAKTRRELYGKAGEFRPTPYGVEYRVLGPYALRSPDIVRTCLIIVQECLDWVVATQRPELGVIQIPNHAQTVQDSINGQIVENAPIGLQYLSSRTRNLVSQPMAPDLYRDWEIPLSS
jgi:hypothetical protein